MEGEEDGSPVLLRCDPQHRQQEEGTEEGADTSEDASLERLLAQPVAVNLYDINKCNSFSLTKTQWAIWYAMSSTCTLTNGPTQLFTPLIQAHGCGCVRKRGNITPCVSPRVYTLQVYYGGNLCDTPPGKTPFGEPISTLEYAPSLSYRASPH